MQFENFSFGSIQIDGSTYEHDVVIDQGQVRKRKKRPSKQFRDTLGHTPISLEEVSRQRSMIDPKEVLREEQSHLHGR